MKKIKKAKKNKIEKKEKQNTSNETKFEKIKRIFWTVVLSGLIVVASLCLIFALYIIISAPDFNKDLLYTKEATVLYYDDGKEMARIGDQNRQLISYNDLPQVFIDALIATEDSRFFQHNGLDIGRFLVASLKQATGTNAGGASTITMQLVKNTYTNNVAEGIEGIIRKFTDIYMAVFKIENCYTKEEIMEFYVNSLWLGHDGNLNYTGIYGVEQASIYYFGKSVSELTLAESSLLVGMYQNARLYNPFNNPVGCRNRQTKVLTYMVQHGYITEEEKNAALAIPVQSLLVDYTNNTSTTQYQDVIDFVLEDVEKKTGLNPYNIPMQIYTTVNKKLQKALQQAEDGVFFKFPDDSVQLGLVITSVENGSITALSGGRNYKAKGLNRATDISRQPGSTAKPLFDYGPYFEYLNGAPGDYLFDEPYTYSNGTRISNADDGYKGMMTLRSALAQSRNIPALQVFQKVAKEDINYIIDFVHKFRINFGETLYESASIGGFEGVSPLQMSAAYAVFGRGGYYIEPYIFSKIIYEDGTSYEYKYKKEKIISEETAYLITDILIDAVKGGSNGKINITGTDVAGKTGTTTIDAKKRSELGIPASGIMDSWNITYSPEYCIAQWYGYDRLTEEDYLVTNQGYKARTALMGGLAKKIFSTNKRFKKPSGVVSVTVEKNTVPLQLPSAYTPSDMKVTELFREGTEPTQVSPRYLKLGAPANGNYTVSGNAVTLTWSAGALPEALDDAALTKRFNKEYGKFAMKYYEKYKAENAGIFGNLGYDIYQQGPDGSTKYIGWYSGTSYTQTLEPGNYKYTIKTAYSNFKANISDGITINVTVNSVLPPNQPKPPEETPNPDAGLE